VEIHPVEQVEKLGTKLEFHALAAHPNLLEQAAVIRDQVGTTESPFTERAISAHGRQHKRRGVEVVNAKGPRRPAGAWCQRIAPGNLSSPITTERRSRLILARRDR